jgi:hypothetical protein
MGKFMSGWRLNKKIPCINPKILYFYPMRNINDLEKTVNDALVAAAKRLLDSPISFKATLDYQRGFFDGVCFVNNWEVNHEFYRKLLDKIRPDDWATPLPEYDPVEFFA